MRRLIDVADEDFRVKLVFASATGVRAGELHALRWQHIGFDASEVKIETRVDAYQEEYALKTEAGVRTVPLAGEVVALLKAPREVLQNFDEAFARTVPPDGELLTVDPPG
jgi:integrase